MNIQGYNFEGPWLLGTNFNDVPGVYVIFTGQICLDVGETDKLGNRINGDNHERKPQWLVRAGGGQIQIAFLNIPDQQRRLAIESSLRLALRPLCGDK